MQKLFPAYIHRSPSGGYGVSFADVAVMAGGDTREDAVQNAMTALATHIDALIEESMPVPEPMTSNEALGLANDNPDLTGGLDCIQLIAVTIPEKSERVMITLPDALLKRMDAVTTNRSGFIAEAVRAKLATDTIPVYDLINNRMVPRGLAAASPFGAMPIDVANMADFAKAISKMETEPESKVLAAHAGGMVTSKRPHAGTRVTSKPGLVYGGTVTLPPGVKLKLKQKPTAK